MKQDNTWHRMPDRVGVGKRSVSFCFFNAYIHSSRLGSHLGIGCCLSVLESLKSNC